MDAEDVAADAAADAKAADARGPHHPPCISTSTAMQHLHGMQMPQCEMLQPKQGNLNRRIVLNVLPSPPVCTFLSLVHIQASNSSAMAHTAMLQQ